MFSGAGKRSTHTRHSRHCSEGRGKQRQWDAFRQAQEMQVNKGVIQAPEHPGQLEEPEETASCECFPLSSPPSGPGEAHILPAPSMAMMERHQDKGTAVWPNCSHHCPSQLYLMPLHTRAGVCWVTADCSIVCVNFKQRKLPNCSLEVTDKLQTIPCLNHTPFPHSHFPFPTLAGDARPDQ